MKKWWKIPAGPVFWMIVVQVAWTITLVAWIRYFVDRRQQLEGWSTMVAGILLLMLVLTGVTVIVIHLARQVAHNRAVKDFVSRVSHDLRSPLSIVRLHLETIQLRELSKSQHDACTTTALTELNRLEKGIEDILAAARIERKGLIVRTEELELAGFLRQYAETRRENLPMLGADLRCEIDPRLRVVSPCDSDLLCQALDNLLNNATTHCPRPVEIVLELTTDGGSAIVSVKDNGPGIQRTERKKVFRMFYRASTERQLSKGTGLGLFIVASIAKAHRGRAWVECPTEGGCRFRISLPTLVTERSE